MLADSFAIFVGTFFLAKGIQKFNIFGEHLNGSRGGDVLFFSIGVLSISLSDELGIVNSVLTSSDLGNVFRLFSFSQRFCFELIHLPSFFFSVDLIKFISIGYFISAKKVQNDGVILFYPGSDSEAVAMKTDHSEHF